MLKKLLTLLLILTLTLTPALAEILVDGETAITETLLVEYGYDYSTPEEVSLYLHVFRELPPNYLTKAEARELGWESSKGNLWDVAYGLSIGGDPFGNREGLLPKTKGRTWYECDVNYYGGYRGSERVLYASDGLIYYTDDHYESFEELYDGWYEGETTYTDDSYESTDDYATEDLISDVLDWLLG